MSSARCPVDVGLLTLDRLGIISKFRALDIFIHDHLEDVPEVHAERAFLEDADFTSLTFCELRIHDLPGLHFADGLLSGPKIERRFVNGSRLFAALSGSTVVAQSWVNCHRASLRQLMWPAIALPDGIAYLHGVITVPAFQRRGIGTLLSHMRLGQLRQEGYWAAVCAIELPNHVSRHWHVANGFKLWGRIRYVQWGSQEWRWRTLTSVGRRYLTLFHHV